MSELRGALMGPAMMLTLVQGAFDGPCLALLPALHEVLERLRQAGLRRHQATSAITACEFAYE